MGLGSKLAQKLPLQGVQTKEVYLWTKLVGFLKSQDELKLDQNWSKRGLEGFKIAGTFFSELQILKKIEVVIQILLIMATFTPGH